MNDYHPTIPVSHQPGDGDVALPATRANCTPLTPLNFLKRADDGYPQRTAIIHGERTLTWQQV